MNLQPTKEPIPEIRWLIRRDMPEVLRIEDESFEYTWSEEYFLSCLRQRNCIGMVLECDHRILGFVIYELHKSLIHILNFAVSPEFRQQGIGRQMVQRMIDKLSQQRRREIILELRETNLSAQLFFGKMGFRAVSVLKDYFEDAEEDAYVLQYRIERTEQEFTPGLAPKNRISDLLDEGF